MIRKCHEVGRAVAGENSRERNKYVRKVARTRNYLTHRDESQEEGAAREEELYRISEDLRLLLEATLMSEIGFGDEEIEQAIFRVYGPRPKVPANSASRIVSA